MKANMKVLPYLVGSVMLVAVAAFCLFGFLATFEPSDSPGMFLGFRIGYAVLGVICLGGISALLAKAFRP